MRQAHRMASNPHESIRRRYEGTTRMGAHGPVWTGRVNLVPEVLDAPLRRRKPTVYFVNSMSDLFHEDVQDEYIDKIFAVMATAGRHTFQVLTKRPERMAAWFARVSERGPVHANLSQSGLIDFYQRHGVDLTVPHQVPARPTPELRFLYDSARGIDPHARVEDQPNPRLCKADGDYHWRGWPLSNVWLGVSCEDQARADERLPHLLRVPAAVRFLSCEPLLSGLHLDLSGVHWLIVGAESGPRARPMDEDWVRSLRDQCREAGVPFFYKQRLDSRGKKVSLPELDGRSWAEMPEAR